MSRPSVSVPRRVLMPGASKLDSEMMAPTSWGASHGPPTARRRPAATMTMPAQAHPSGRGRARFERVRPVVRVTWRTSGADWP